MVLSIEPFSRTPRPPVLQGSIAPPPPPPLRVRVSPSSCDAAGHPGGPRATDGHPGSALRVKRRPVVPGAWAAPSVRFHNKSAMPPSASAKRSAPIFVSADRASQPQAVGCPAAQGDAAGTDVAVALRVGVAVGVWLGAGVALRVTWNDEGQQHATGGKGCTGACVHSCEPAHAAVHARARARWDGRCARTCLCWCVCARAWRAQ